MDKSSQPFFPFVVDWVNSTSTVVPLYFCSDHGGARVLESGAAAVDSKDQAASYLTQVPAHMSLRPETSLEIPADEIELALSVTTRGIEVSLWMLEFYGEQQVAKTSWPLKQDRTVRWKPHQDCDSIRLGWRLKGTGTLDSARLTARELGYEAKETERLMTLWHALSAPKAALDGATVTGSNECPKYLGSSPEVILPAAVATHPFFRSRGIDASKIILDGPVFEGVLDPRVWPYLQQTIAEGAYQWTSPFTGELIRSADTFLVSEPAGRPYVLVRFESAGHVFFLILCPFRCSRIGVYFPGEEIVVSRLKLGNLIRGLRSLAVRNAVDFQRYLTTVEPRKTLVPINTMSHWGHVVLNELDALQWLFDSGNDSRIDLWLRGEVGFVNFDELFDEIPRARLHDAFSADDRFRFCVRENALIIRPQIASCYLGERAGTRLVEFWKAAGDHNGSNADIEAKLAGLSPVIWCEIRANDRIWTNQLEGLQTVVAKLKPRYPNMAIVLAGWSRMLEASAEDEKMIASEARVMKAITDALEGTTCVPVLGVPTAAKLLWALSCDLHISIVGSGLLFALLARLPGVTLVSRYYQENELCLGDAERQVNFMYGVARLVVLPTRFVTDDPNIANGEIRDFRVDAEALADLVDAELAKLRADH